MLWSMSAMENPGWHWWNNPNAAYAGLWNVFLCWMVFDMFNCTLVGPSSFTTGLWGLWTMNQLLSILVALQTNICVHEFGWNWPSFKQPVPYVHSIFPSSPLIMYSLQESVPGEPWGYRSFCKLNSFLLCSLSMNFFLILSLACLRFCSLIVHITLKKALAIWQDLERKSRPFFTFGALFLTIWFMDHLLHNQLS